MRRRTFYTDSNGCLIGNGATDKDGYCKAWDKTTKTNTFAHRLAYEKKYGSIPEGLVIDHKCRVRRCSNPDHLQVVTITENTRLGSVAKLNPEKIKQIKSMRNRGLTQGFIARQMGVHQAQISRLLNGKAWNVS